MVFMSDLLRHIHNPVVHFTGASPRKRFILPPYAFSRRDNASVKKSSRHTMLIPYIFHHTFTNEEAVFSFEYVHFNL